mmetsp:Transcript_15300/g.24657  ORF Transcript_15300/g.24657 Transcript_15300/m.24657 type:complete len:84 (-) Transcript_15300:524-775(-)
MPSRDSDIRSTPPHDAIYRVVFLSIIRSTQINMKSTIKAPSREQKQPIKPTIEFFGDAYTGKRQSLARMIAMTEFRPQRTEYL